MTPVSVKLEMPAKLKEQARKAGLLSGKFLRGAIESELIRRQAAQRLLKTSRDVAALSGPPMGEDEIAAEIKAARAARRDANAHRR